MENSSAKRHYYQAYEMRHALSDIDVRLTALERGGTEPKVSRNEPQCECVNCGFKGTIDEMRAHGYTHLITLDIPKPAPATVERFMAFEFRLDREHEMCGRWLRKPIGEVVATPEESCNLVRVVLPSGEKMHLMMVEYRALVEHLTSAGVWERQNG